MRDGLSFSGHILYHKIFENKFDFSFSAHTDR